MAGQGENISPELQFLAEFSKQAKLVGLEEDGIQYRTSGIYLDEKDFEGEVTDWALQYLYSHKCPYELAAQVARATCAEIKLTDLNEYQLQQNGETHLASAVDSGKLQQAVYKKVHEICEIWKDKPYVSMEKRHLWPLSVCAVKNSRRRMEDRHVVIPDLNGFFGFENKSPRGYYAVFDGHAGPEAAAYASAHLHHHVARHPVFNTDIETAIKEGFKKTDEFFVEKAKRENLKCGSTAVCAIVQDSDVHLAWVGDSQAYVVRQGVPVEIVTPHVPSRDDERDRIEKEGGCVVFYGTWRVNGTLAISRAIGDFEYKPYVSSEPDVYSLPRDGTEDFIIMACDGLWDVTPPDDAAHTVYSCLIKNRENIDDVAEKLVQSAIQRNSSDNITVIVIFLKDPAEIASAGIPSVLVEAIQTPPIQQSTKFPQGCVTNGESPTKIPNLWMSDVSSETSAENSKNVDESPDLDEKDAAKPSKDSVLEYFLAQPEEQKFSFENENAILSTESPMSSSQVSLSSFDSKGACQTPSPDGEQNVLLDTRIETNTDVPSPTSPSKTEVTAPTTDSNPISGGASPQSSPVVETSPLPSSPSRNVILMASQSSLSPSAPEFIPHGFQFNAETNLETNISSPLTDVPVVESSVFQADVVRSDDTSRDEGNVDEEIVVDTIPDNVPTAEDVVDDESEDGEGWRYIQMTKEEENKENIVPPTQPDVVAGTPDDGQVNASKEDLMSMEIPAQNLDLSNLSTTTQEMEANLISSPVKSPEVNLSFGNQSPEANLSFGNQSPEATLPLGSPKSSEANLLHTKNPEETFPVDSPDSATSGKKIEMDFVPTLKSEVNIAASSMSEKEIVSPTSEREILPSPTSEREILPSPTSESGVSIPVKQECDTTNDLLDFSESKGSPIVSSPLKSDLESTPMEEDFAILDDKVGIRNGNASASESQDLFSFNKLSDSLLNTTISDLDTSGVVLSPTVETKVVEVKQEIKIVQEVKEKVAPTKAASSTSVEKKSATTRGKTATTATLTKSKSQTTTTATSAAKTTAKPRSTLTPKSTTSSTTTTTKATTDKKPAPKATTTSTTKTSTLTKTTTLTKPRTEAKKPATTTAAKSSTTTTATKNTSTLAKRPTTTSTTTAANKDVKATSSTLTRTTSSRTSGTMKKPTTSTLSTSKPTTTSTLSASKTTTGTTKTTKDTTNKQISSTVRQTRTTTATRTLSNAKDTSQPTKKATTTTTSTSAASRTTTTTMRKTSGAPSTTTTTTTTSTATSKRPTSAPAKGRAATAKPTTLTKSQDTTKKEKGILEEKTKEQVLLAATPTDGHGDSGHVLPASSPGNAQAQEIGQSPNHT